MLNKEMLSISTLLAPQIINEIMEAEGLSLIDATKAFYFSNLYKKIMDEDTGLWHLSPKALYLLLKQEREGKEYQFPEEAF